MTDALRLFGTDGIRGAYGVPPLTAATVTALAAALAATLLEKASAPRVILGGDTRESTPEICALLAAGLTAGGVEVEVAGTAGILPTPGIGHLVAARRASAGIAVSASHNPYPDNGIKLLDPSGRKWSNEAERALEGRMAGLLRSTISTVSTVAQAVPLSADPELQADYLDHLAATLPPGRPLAGLRIVLDAGNGAAFQIADPLFTRLGAAVTLLGAHPDGRNVNQGCGSTAPACMATAVLAAGAHLGAAFDGDADRAILADERGTVRDGDAMLYLWATHLHRRGELRPAKIVATSMSNLGLERALAREGIGIERCDVGDRYVVEAMERAGILLGGEQSGHLIHSALSSTGDGLLTALQLAAIVHQAGVPMSSLLAGFRRYPQILKNIRVREKVDFAAMPTVTAAARSVEDRLGEDGRLVLRYSGTEPLARIMIEGPDQGMIDGLAAELGAAIGGEIGA